MQPNRKNLATRPRHDIIESVAPERESPYVPPYERRDCSLLFVLAIIISLFVIVVLLCLFIMYAVTHFSQLPDLSAQAVDTVKNMLVWLGGMIVIGVWLFFIKFVIGIGRDAGETFKVWVQAMNEIPKRHLWGMNTTHVVTDGKVPTRIESVRERSEHFHYGDGTRRDEERDESEEAEPVPRSSQILDQMRRRRYDSHAS